MSYILCIETANPIYCIKQEDNATFFSNAIPDGDSKSLRKINAVSAKSGIKRRYSVLSDFNAEPKNFTFFPKNKQLEPAPTIDARMEIYKSEALKLSLLAINKIKGFEINKGLITHIITVTCTGLFAPGLDLQLIESLKLNPTTERCSINFMGCNAAVLALKQADYICRAQPNSLVLIVCTELCTIHFQKNFDDDYILSNLLFSDGSAATLVSSENKEIDASYKTLKINNFKSLIANEGKQEMAWRVASNGFVMNLTTYVSSIINTHLPTLLKEINSTKDEFAHWAIHPGGKKIVDDVSKTLQLQSSNLSASYFVLENYGNMSSPTLLFVIKHISDNHTTKINDLMFAAAFGPGLSIESATLQYV